MAGCKSVFAVMQPETIAPLLVRSQGVKRRSNLRGVGADTPDGTRSEVDAMRR